MNHESIYLKQVMKNQFPPEQDIYTDIAKESCQLIIDLKRGKRANYLVII